MRVRDRRCFPILGPFIQAQYNHTSRFRRVSYIFPWAFTPSCEAAIMTYSSRAIVARIHEQLDVAWNKEYVKFLDLNGREPRPLDERSIALISAFFVVSWGL